MRIPPSEDHRDTQKGDGNISEIEPGLDRNADIASKLERVRMLRKHAECLFDTAPVFGFQLPLEPKGLLSTEGRRRRVRGGPPRYGEAKKRESQAEGPEAVHKLGHG